MQVGSSPDDHSSTHVADHAGREDGAVDDSQDRRLDWRAHAQPEVTLKVGRHVEVLGRVRRRRRSVRVNEY